MFLQIKFILTHKTNEIYNSPPLPSSLDTSNFQFEISDIQYCKV